MAGAKLQIECDGRMGQKYPIKPSNSSGMPNRESADLPILRFSTQGHGPRDQFDRWRETLETIVDARLPPEVKPSDGYKAEITAVHFGNLIFSAESFDAVEYELTAREARRGKVDHWLVTLNKRGRFVSRMGDDTMESSPGTIGVRSLTRPFKGYASTVDMIFLYIPRDLHPSLSASLDALNNTAMSGGMQVLLREFLLLLERQILNLATDELPRVARALDAMLTACLVASPDALAEAKPELMATLRGRARRHIREHIRSPTLSPDELSRVLGISRTQLYRLFDGEGGIARQIRVQRLLLARAALLDPSNLRPIYQIAQEFGFGSQTEFGRSFRQHFGCTPMDARRSSEAVISSVSCSPTQSFTDWMLNLGR
ncbi:AraC family transcriptional regulator [Ancylobacter sp. 6x-1]|uniref:AraC family transcriptional regulator n=1 Tax=Ancylobacter crimeensis TaxID=2579147 RepID=A0ABT0DEZ1_9HYPH|nr:AraC family transcriptional regulator [Ancylobacter crimeensis]MCK0198537.1 AraC family transcriptional regulator [Ancylobacter crimeensis]